MRDVRYRIGIYTIFFYSFAVLLFQFRHGWWYMNESIYYVFPHIADQFAGCDRLLRSPCAICFTPPSPPPTPTNLFGLVVQMVLTPKPEYSQPGRHIEHYICLIPLAGFLPFPCMRVCGKILCNRITRPETYVIHVVGCSRCGCQCMCESVKTYILYTMPPCNGFNIQQIFSGCCCPTNTI